MEDNSKTVKKMAKNIRVFGLIMCIVVLAVMFLYMQMNKKEPQEEGIPQTTKNRLLEMDLVKGYPETAKGVIETYGKLLQFVYNHPSSDGSVSDEEMKKLLEQIRMLYHSDLGKENPFDKQMTMLQEEIKGFQKNDLRIASMTVDDKMEKKKIDGKQCALMNMNIMFSNPDGKTTVMESFILAVEDNEWKILGFQPVKNIQE